MGGGDNFCGRGTISASGLRPWGTISASRLCPGGTKSAGRQNLLRHRHFVTGLWTVPPIHDSFTAEPLV